MNQKGRIHQYEVWAQLLLAEHCQKQIADFFVNDLGIHRDHVARRMHLTVYHARRPMPGLVPALENINVVVPAEETRFMVMAPGGENPRKGLDPSKRKVGIRLHKQCAAMPQVLKLRERLLAHETESVLGSRSPSSNKSNAFGARSFQPHLTLLYAGSGIGRDLTGPGKAFREAIDSLTFDRFLIEIAERNQT
ncbi:MAG: hypothetical protein KDN20_02600 [Verrucomicrobiae bacterium]|nr:hypothetical protein [Verrucomicrobiae bacterium]